MFTIYEYRCAEIVGYLFYLCNGAKLKEQEGAWKSDT